MVAIETHRSVVIDQLGEATHQVAIKRALEILEPLALGCDQQTQKALEAFISGARKIGIIAEQGGRGVQLEFVDGTHAAFVAATGGSWIFMESGKSVPFVQLPGIGLGSYGGWLGIRHMAPFKNELGQVLPAPFEYFVRAGL